MTMQSGATAAHTHLAREVRIRPLKNATGDRGAPVVIVDRPRRELLSRDGGTPAAATPVAPLVLLPRHRAVVQTLLWHSSIVVTARVKVKADTMCLLATKSACDLLETFGPIDPTKGNQPFGLHSWHSAWDPIRTAVRSVRASRAHLGRAIAWGLNG